jgi:hypothetical protein
VTKDEGAKYVSTLDIDEVLSEDKRLFDADLWEEQIQFHISLGLHSRNPDYEKRCQELGIGKLYVPNRDLFALCRLEHKQAYDSAFDKMVESVGGDLSNLKSAPQELKDAAKLAYRTALRIGAAAGAPVRGPSIVPKPVAEEVDTLQCALARVAELHAAVEHQRAVLVEAREFVTNITIWRVGYAPAEVYVGGICDKVDTDALLAKLEALTEN